MRHYVLRVSVSYLMMPKQRKWVCVVQNSIACGSLSTNEPDNSLSTSFLTYGFVAAVPTSMPCAFCVRRSLSGRERSHMNRYVMLFSAQTRL